MMNFVRHDFKMMTHVIVFSMFLWTVAATLDQRLPPSVTKQTINCQDTGGEHVCVYRDDGAVTFECEASGHPAPTFEWYKNGELLDQSVRNNIKPNYPGGIIINPATSLDEGYYQCRAENAYGTALGWTYRIVKATLAGYAPNLPIQDKTVSPGEHLQIKCATTKSVPRAVFSWAIAEGTVDERSTPLNTSPRINIDPFGNLYFSAIKNSDSLDGKLYKCNVFNAQLDLTVGGSYTRVNIIKPGPTPNKGPIKQYFTPAPHIALVDRYTTIQCLFSGSPAPSITWSKKNGQLPAGRTEYKSFNSQLEIKTVRESDEGTYTCTGSNSAGRDDQDIFVKVEAVPVFRSAVAGVRPVNTNATVGDDVTFNCKPYAIPMAITQWLMNGVPIDAGNPPERISISADRQSLTVSKVCKDCKGARTTDLMVIQCNASNVHGYAFGDGYLNVLLPTMFTLPPPEVLQVDIETVLELHCRATSDDSTPVIYQWHFNDQKLILNPPYTNVDNNNTLVINTNGLEGEFWKEHAGKYTCKVSNGYSAMSADCLVKLPPGVKPITTAGIGSLWWIFVILALVLLFLILFLVCCLCMQRNKGDTYPVDEKERQHGHDPEKELADNDFIDYQRPESAAQKESRTNLGNTTNMNRKNEDSLPPYDDFEPAYYNQDGSFVDLYNEKNKKALDSTV